LLFLQISVARTLPSCFSFVAWSPPNFWLPCISFSRGSHSQSSCLPLLSFYRSNFNRENWKLSMACTYIHKSTECRRGSSHLSHHIQSCDIKWFYIICSWVANAKSKPPQSLKTDDNKAMTSYSVCDNTHVEELERKHPVAFEI
jgi:hypothetical protein